jgi:hypothetical protein
MRKAIIRFFIYIFGSGFLAFSAAFTPIFWDELFFDGLLTAQYQDGHVNFVIMVFIFSFPLIYFIFAIIDNNKRKE